jgi:CRP-like cAMP-binding protein
MDGSKAVAYSPARLQHSAHADLSPDLEPELRDPNPSAPHNNLVRAMRVHPVFAYLSASQFRNAVLASRTDDVDAGVVLYQRGETARHFYLLIEGRVNLALFAPSGDAKIIELLGPGKLFGEVGMFSEGGAYPVTAITTTKARVARLSNRDYLNVLRECPDACLRMLGHLADRLGRHVQQIEGSTLECATDRIVRMLAARLPQAVDGPATVWFDESRQDLASYLSMKPETLSRALRSLAERGAISVHGRQIRVPSRVVLLQQLEAPL